MNLRMHRSLLRTWRICARLSFWLAASWSPLIFAQSSKTLPLCRAVQLEPFLDDDNCGMGRCDQSVDFRNVSATTCTLPEDTSVRAVNRRGAVIKVEHPRAEDGPVVLRPGDFGEYVSETYTGGEDAFPNPPPFADTYLFRFSADDPGVLRVPGAQALDQGAQSTFDKNPPDLSKFPRQTSGKFTFSVLPWPIMEPDPHRVFDLYSNPSIGVHVSLKNQRASASLGWNACHIITVASEVRPANRDEPAAVPEESGYPCDWNGDLSHGAIAAGATVAMEVEAKLPRVCHLARYKVSVSLAYGPARFGALDLYTDELQPDCDDSRTIPSPVPKLVIPPDLKLLEPLHYGLPVDGIRLGLEIPARFADSRGVGTLFPGDPIIASVWVDNGRDTPLHLAGAHGFHLKIRSFTTPSEPRNRRPGYRNPPPVELAPRVGSNDTGPIDITIPPHSKLLVAQIDLGARYDFPAGPIGFQRSVFLYPDSLPGEDAKWNWDNDQNNAYALKTVAAFHVEPSDSEK
jgi:hypothetical protein